MRPVILLLLAGLAVSALGCQESGFDERKETVRPLKVQHVLGETKVPGRAERPLTLTVDALDDALALRARPVRAAVPGARLPGYLRRVAGAVDLMPPLTERAQLAALKAAHPDLILGSDTGQGRFYAPLSAVAPTVLADAGSGQWKLNLRLVGEALGRTNDAERLLTDYDRSVARVRRAIRGKPRVAVVRTTATGPQLAKRDSFAGTILADVGVRQARSVAQADVVIRGGEQTWWGPGGVLEARAALAQLNEILRG